MAFGDEGFYGIDGTYINRELLVQYMINYYNEKYPESQITDFNEGSEIRNLLEALAVDIFHLELNDQQILTASFLSTSYGTYLDLFGEELNTPRVQGRQAWGTCTFTIPQALTYPITIPAPTTLVAEDTGLFYNTSITVEIPIGETSVDCTCYSQVTGAGTNAEADTITLFQDPTLFPEVTVTNTEAFTGGTDIEPDNEYRERLLTVKGQDNFGSLEYYKRIGNRVKGVHDVALVTSSNGYTAKVLVNGYEKPLDEDILATVTEVYTLSKNIVYDHTFEVAETGYTTKPLEITAVVTDEVENSLFEDLLELFFNGGEATIANTQFNMKGCNINESATNYQILTALETLPFVVQITSMTTGNATFSKLTPGTNKALKLGTVTITQQVAE